MHKGCDRNNRINKERLYRMKPRCLAFLLFCFAFIKKNIIKNILAAKKILGRYVSSSKLRSIPLPGDFPFFCVNALQFAHYRIYNYIYNICIFFSVVIS